MTLFKPPQDRRDREEAEANFDRFVAAGPARLAWFIEEVEREVGRRPEPTMEDLTWLGPAVAARLTDEHPVSAPEWFHSTARKQSGWSDYGAALTDGLIYLIAEIYRREFGAVWVLNADPLHADYNRPVMSVRLLTAPWRAVAILMKVHSGERESGELATWVTCTLQAAREEMDAGGSEEYVLEVAVDPSDLQGFDWRIWVDEGAEMELGTEVFMGLWERFEAIPGVLEVMHEDRETFYVKAPGIDATDLESKAKEIVYSLHADAKNQNG